MFYNLRLKNAICLRGKIFKDPLYLLPGVRHNSPILLIRSVASNGRNIRYPFFHALNYSKFASEHNNIEEHHFQAETKMLLDIVAHSLYSEKEVFIREIVSNASDALEKFRYMGLQNEDLASRDLKINIETDKYKNTISIHDNGIGMTKEELIENLGKIAHSGSKEFIQNLQRTTDKTETIIGQFGVGFYSTFMVADKVNVFTSSHRNPSYCWTSDGSGKYTIEDYEDFHHGTKIVCHLKMSDREFSDEQTVKNILKKYSSFVNFPIYVNGTKVNTMEPLWLKDSKAISNEDHIQFYQFIGGAYDKPRFVFNFQTDIPLSIRCLLYFPEAKPGLFETGRECESNVSLYCRRILIKSQVDNLIPKWMRFVKGVVDSEDIPLNLSREMLQDSPLIRKIKTVIQNKVVRYLADKSQKDPMNYLEFFNNYGIFIKEGIISTQEQYEKEELARLLMYESSSKEAGAYTTLAEYVGRMPDDQREIFYLAAPSRELALSSPYYESLKKANVEVLFCFESYDEVVLMQLRQYNNKAIVSVEKEIRQDKESYEFDSEGSKLSAKEVADLMSWMKSMLAGRCFSIKTTPHLDKHPCIVTVEEMGAARHFVKTQFQQLPEESRFSILRPQLEINTSHSLILKLNSIRTTNPRLGELLLKQLFNNAMVTAGLIDDPRTVLLSFNELLELALQN